MGMWKVKETIVVSGWTFVEADSEGEAIKLIEDSDDDFNDIMDSPIYCEHQDTQWNTLTKISEE